VSVEEPLPPEELVQRVHRIEGPDIESVYLSEGRVTRERLQSLLPPDWAWTGKRVLDFGCGAGRTLRHLLDQAVETELHGCDVHAPSIRWLEENLSPPLHVVENDHSPPVPYLDGYFDLVYAFSVFTHLADSWAEWLLELRRILRPEGLLVATFLSEQSWEIFEGSAWDEERTGMIVTKRSNPWDSGGPFVYLSEWWLREHWGRAFEIVYLERRPPSPLAGQSAGAVVAHPRTGSLQPEDLRLA
jgi:SAM-dependent methyltransferase